MKPTNRLVRTVPLLFLSCLVLSVSGGLLAQSGSAKSRSKGKDRTTAKAKELAVRAQQSREKFLRETATIAKELEEAGHLEEAKEMLQTILKLEPKLKPVREKIKQIDEELLGANEHNIEIDVSNGWGPPRAKVAKNKPFRIETSGSYRFVTSLTVGPAGFPTNDPTKDMAAGVPCGALMGLIVSKGKAGKPFPIGTGREIVPKNDGLLFLGVNLPPGHKCNGRLRASMSGYVQTP